MQHQTTMWGATERSVAHANDSNTKLLLHFEEVDGGTDFDDSSASAHGTTYNGTAQVDDAQKKFGIGSCKFDGNSDWIIVGDHADFAVGSDPFTLDLWVMIDSSTTNDHFWEQYVDSTHRLNCHLIKSDRSVTFAVTDPGGNITIRTGANAVPLDDVWYHLALIRGWGGNNDEWAWTVNGRAIWTETDSDTVPDLAADVTIGMGDSDGVRRYFKGWIDELRFTKGVARWTQNFWVPEQPYA